MLWLGMDENHRILSDFQHIRPNSRTRPLRFGTSVDTAPAPWLGSYPQLGQELVLHLGVGLGHFWIRLRWNGGTKLKLELSNLSDATLGHKFAWLHR